MAAENMYAPAAFARKDTVMATAQNESIGTNERSSEDEIGLNIKLPKQKTSWLHLQMS